MNCSSNVQELARIQQTPAASFQPVLADQRRRDPPFVGGRRSCECQSKCPRDLILGGRPGMLPYSLGEPLGLSQNE
jgi:hypothetical protein